MARSFKTVAAQTIHYLGRPHDGVRREPLDVPAAWRARDFRGPASWQEGLDDAAVAEVERALAVARATGKPLGRLTARDFPIPGLAARVAQWRHTLSVRGRGFVVLRGVPVDRWERADVERFYWCLGGQHLGTPGAQNGAGDLLGHVLDEGWGRNDRDVRAYRTSAAIAFHCDAADVVGLLCLAAAPAGGRSRIASSVTVYNELLARAPRLTERLYRPFALDTRGDGGVRWFEVPPCRHSRGVLRTFYHADYFRTAARHADAPPLGDLERELLDTYDAIAGDPDVHLEMDLAPGDVQLLSNHTIVHGRTAYDDAPAAQGSKRHLLRLWLSLADDLTWGERLGANAARAALVGTLIRHRLARA